MAASMEGLCRSQVSLFSRVIGGCRRQTNRSCHVSVQEPPARHTSTQLSASIRGPLKQSRNRLLSDRMSSAMTVHPLSVVRTYSALPQRAIFTSPFWNHEEHTSSSETSRKCWKCGRETDAMKELFFCHCGVVQSPADSVTFFSLFGIEEGFDVDLKRLSEQFKDLQKHLHPDMYSQKSEVNGEGVTVFNKRLRERERERERHTHTHTHTCIHVHTHTHTHTRTHARTHTCLRP